MLAPIGEYLPDLPEFGNPGSPRVVNMIPRTPSSYGPMPSFAGYSSNTLAGRAQGAHAATDSAGDGFVFAGDAARLYQLAAGPAAFTDVTRTAGPYQGDPATGRWSFTQYGGTMLASNFADPIQAMALGGTHFADLPPGAPRARYLAVVRDFLVAGFTSDALGLDPQQVHWSAINDPTNWPAPGAAAALAVQSDFQTIAGDHGWLTGIVANLGYADAALFFERAIFRMHYAGGSTIFQFTAAEGARGTQAPGSIAQLGALVYYLGEDGFYAFDGASSRSIGANKVDRTFFADLDLSQIGRVESAVDPVNRLVFWSYPGLGGGASGGAANRLLVYHVTLDRWALIADIQAELIFRAVSLGSSLESLDATGYSLDMLPASLDSRVWTGGRPLLGAFDANHRLGYLTGPALAASADTAELQLNPGGRAIVATTRPLVDSAAAQVSLAARQSLQAAVAFGPAVGLNALGECPQRSSGRYHRARVSVPAGAGFTHLQGVELTATAEGGR